MKIPATLLAVTLSVAPCVIAKDNPSGGAKTMENEQAKKKATADSASRMPNPDTMTVADMHKHCGEMMAEPKSVSNQELLQKYSKLADVFVAKDKAKRDSAAQSESIRQMPNPDTLSAEALRQHCKDMMKEPAHAKPASPHSQKGHKGVD